MLRGLLNPPSLLRASQFSPSPAAEGCAPSLTLYLGGQLTVPGSLVGTEVALDPHAHMGPPDLDRHTVD